MQYLTQSALAIATSAHQGQVDKEGKPYILHVLRVANNSRELCYETVIQHEKAYIVGLLHDVVEDSNITIEDLIMMGFPEDITNAVDAITKREGETELEYVYRVKIYPLSTIVKICDTEDNMDDRRFGISDKKRSKYREMHMDLLNHANKKNF